jgi:hypothetical protein
MPERRRADGAEAVVASDEDRKRVIDLALARRPDMELDELHGVLARLGIDVDTDTLVADLDALGYEVEDEPGGATAADAGPTPGDGPRFTAPPDDDAFDDALAAEVRDLDGDGGLQRYAPVMVAVAAALAVLVAAFLVLGGDDDDPAATGAGPSTVPTGQGANAGAGSAPVAAGPPRVAPSGPGPDPALVEPDVAFPFDTDGATLPPPPDGGEWTVTGGDVEVTGGRAVSTAPGDVPVLATFPMATPDARVQVTLPEASEGAGLAFRLDDSGTYYAWVVAPPYSTVNLYEVTDGEQESVLNSGITVVKPGVTLGLNLIGSGVELFANGVVVATFAEAGDGVGLGLVATSKGVPGVFDDLLVQYA